MSEVISFRLGKGNPREARAWEVLQIWTSQGYSARHVITEALIKLSEESNQTTTQALEELSEAMRQVMQLLEHMQNGSYVPSADNDGESSKSALTDAFVASVKQAARPGMKLD